MIALLGILWVLYLAECFVSWHPGDWIFRPGPTGGMRGADAPDITFLDGRFGFAWTSLLPGATSHIASGGSLDRRRTRLRLGRMRTDTAWLRILSTGLFVLVMAVFPALVVTERLLSSLLAFVSVLVLAWAGTLGALFAAHRRVHGSGPKIETWLVLALSPLSLIRAPHVVSMRALDDIHPVAAADALCENEEFLRIARLWHFDCPELRPAIRRLATRRGLLQHLTAPPSNTEPGVSRFCERCHATFREGATNCADCEDVTLTPLPSAALGESGAAAAAARE